MRSTQRVFLFAALVLLFVAATVDAQIAASITGTVKDGTGAPVPGITVAVDGRTATTDASGQFTIFGVEPGEHVISFFLAGFSTTQRTLTVEPGTSTAIDVIFGPNGLIVEPPSISPTLPPPIYVPPSTSAPPPTTGRPALPQLAWNTWAQTNPALMTVAIAPRLAPDTDYYVIVDLSGVRLTDTQGAETSLVRTILDEWLRNNKDESAALKVVMVVDERAFERPAENAEDLIVNLTKLREFQPDGDASPLDRLKSGEASFGRIAFRVHTVRDFVGAGAISFSVWVNGRVPVDEFGHSFCIAATAATDCVATQPQGGFSGLDSLRLAAEDTNATYPDAALHFVEVGNIVAGVFRCNTCGWAVGEFKSWRVGEKTARNIADDIEKTIRRDLQNSDINDDAFLRHGGDLYREFFGGRTDADAARRAFEDFVQADGAPSSAQTARSIFIRFLAASRELEVPVPLGLMAVPVSPSQDDFLGFRFRIETPLARQDYRPVASCIDRWVVFAPDGADPTVTTEMREAIMPAADWLRAFDASSSRSGVYHDAGSFSKWLRTPPVDTGDSTAVLVLSHHDTNSLYFTSADTVEPQSVQRSLKTPSVVILAACGSAAPGAFEFLDQFNARGASTAVATATNVRADMAGRYVKALLDTFDARNGSTIAEAHFHAVREVADQTDITTVDTRDLGPDTPRATPRRYGARALQFMLLGNGNITLCTPPQPQ